MYSNPKRLNWDELTNKYIEKHIVCTCGVRAKFVEFNTFSYWYCKECKQEVGEDDFERAFRSWD